MKQVKDREDWPAAAGGATCFLLLLPLDLVWTPTFIAIKVAVNAVSVLVYMGVLVALWNGRAEPIEHGGLLFVLGLVTLPHILLLAVFYYNGLLCMVVSASLAAALLVDCLRVRKKRK